MRDPFRAVLDDTSGVSAVEFAIAAPVLILGLLGMIDAGRMAATRMEMDRNIRAGAQAAMSLNNDPDAIETIVVASADNRENFDVAVAIVCSCSEVTGSCTEPCASGEAPSVFFDISAAQPYSGILIDTDIETQSRVQIR
jgi:Flp pilus assembly protein TadG